MGLSYDTSVIIFVDLSVFQHNSFVSLYPSRCLYFYILFLFIHLCLYLAAGDILTSFLTRPILHLTIFHFVFFHNLSLTSPLLYLYFTLIIEMLLNDCPWNVFKIVLAGNSTLMFEGCCINKLALPMNRWKNKTPPCTHTSTRAGMVQQRVSVLCVHERSPKYSQSAEPHCTG